ncbi:hypothetical protein [Verrucomicrobium spinosum]|uniref:hypothetical protein n=1 Tax=Verrucomicrobium spinosum TaxID=2736 RepID=UPI0001746073|nr:hypothetical protein [Verrucomicrobium spinosum]
MKASACCSRNKAPASKWGRGGEIASWLLPTATLALIPKCPACVAGYVALATGIGITLPTATYLRASLILLCVASLAFLVVRRLRRLNAARAASRCGTTGRKTAPAPPA